MRTCDLFKGYVFEHKNDDRMKIQSITYDGFFIHKIIDIIYLLLVFFLFHVNNMI